MSKNTKKAFVFIYLHIAIFIYALSSLFSKKAATTSLFSFSFILFYALSLACLVIYAILWQQILKHLPLSVAYANKAIVILWQLIFGAMFFHETISIKQIIGLLIISSGIMMMMVIDDDGD